MHHYLQDVFRKHRVKTYAYAVTGCDPIFTSGGVWQSSALEPFRAGSLSKVIVAMGILRLEEAGKLRLSDPVARYLPDLDMPNEWSATDPVRIVHLLEHTAGLDDMHFNEYYVGNEEVDIALVDALVRNPASKRVRWRPGKRSAYSNVGYAIAARVIEVVTGSDAGNWLRENVLRPMGMWDSFFDRAVSFPDDVAPKSYATYLYYPAVGLVTTVFDMYQLLNFLLNEGCFRGRTILSPASVQRMMRSESSLIANRGWYDGDFGLGVRVWQDSSNLRVEATGMVDGFLSKMIVYPYQGKAWALLSTTAAEPGRFLEEATQAFDQYLDIPSISIHPQRVASRAKPGTYHYLSPRNALFAFHDDLFVELEVGKPSMTKTRNFFGQLPGQEPFLLVFQRNDLPKAYTKEYHLVTAGITSTGTDYLVIEGKYFERNDSLWPSRLRALFWIYKGIVYLFTALLPFFLIAQLSRRESLRAHWKLTLIGVLPYWCGALAYFMLTSEKYRLLGEVSAYSLFLSLLSLLIPVFTVAAAILIFRRGLIRWLHLPLVLGNLGLTAYLIAYGMLPFLSWRY